MGEICDGIEWGVPNRRLITRYGQLPDAHIGLIKKKETQLQKSAVVFLFDIGRPIEANSDL